MGDRYVPGQFVQMFIPGCVQLVVIIAGSHFQCIEIAFVFLIQLNELIGVIRTVKLSAVGFHPLHDGQQTVIMNPVLRLICQGVNHVRRGGRRNRDIEVLQQIIHRVIDDQINICRHSFLDECFHVSCESRDADIDADLCHFKHEIAFQVVLIRVVQCGHIAVQAVVDPVVQAQGCGLEAGHFLVVDPLRIADEPVTECLGPGGKNFGFLLHDTECRHGQHEQDAEDHQEQSLCGFHGDTSRERMERKTQDS